jgi:mannose-6-phosphate isomerase-like protein (cupin superfamily)
MTASSVNLLSGEGLAWRETPYGRGAMVASQPGFEIVWIYKDQEPVDPSLITMEVDDVIVILQGGLKLELRAEDPQDVILGPGDAFTIPAGIPFRGYRYPRDQIEPTVFIAVYGKRGDRRDR